MLRLLISFVSCEIIITGSYFKCNDTFFNAHITSTNVRFCKIEFFAVRSICFIKQLKIGIYCRIFLRDRNGRALRFSWQGCILSLSCLALSLEDFLNNLSSLTLWWTNFLAQLLFGSKLNAANKFSLVLFYKVFVCHALLIGIWFHFEQQANKTLPKILCPRSGH